MRAITARRSMRRCIKLLESNDGSLSHDQLCQLWSDKSTQTALSILDHKGYVSILFADDEPYSIALTVPTIRPAIQNRTVTQSKCFTTSPPFILLLIDFCFSLTELYIRLVDLSTHIFQRS